MSSQFSWLGPTQLLALHASHRGLFLGPSDLDNERDVGGYACSCRGWLEKQNDWQLLSSSGGGVECRKGVLSSSKMKCPWKGAWPYGKAVTLKRYWPRLSAERSGLVTCLSPTVQRGIEIFHELNFSFCELKHRCPNLKNKHCQPSAGRQKGGIGTNALPSGKAENCSQKSIIPLIVQGHQTVYVKMGLKTPKSQVSDQCPLTKTMKVNGLAKTIAPGQKFRKQTEPQAK